MLEVLIQKEKLEGLSDNLLENLLNVKLNCNYFSSKQKHYFSFWIKKKLLTGPTQINYLSRKIELNHFIIIFKFIRNNFGLIDQNDFEFFFLILNRIISVLHFKESGCTGGGFNRKFEEFLGIQRSLNQFYKLCLIFRSSLLDLSKRLDSMSIVVELFENLLEFILNLFEVFASQHIRATKAIFTDQLWYNLSIDCCEIVLNILSIFCSNN